MQIITQTYLFKENRRYRPKNVLASLRYQKGIEQKDLHGKGLNS